MSRIIIIIFIIVILIGSSLLFFKNSLMGKKSLPSPKVQIVSVKKTTPTPTSTPNPTPVEIKNDYKMDLSKELESVDPQVLDSDFEGLNNLLSSF